LVSGSAMATQCSEAAGFSISTDDGPRAWLHPER